LTQAREAITSLVRQTPTVVSTDLSQRIGALVALKLENLQVTGSFKVRGAANKLLSLSDEEKESGVVTCSSGNHGKAVAYVAQALGIRATVCVPEWVDPVKLAAIEQHGAEAVREGSTYDEAEERSFEIAREREATYVSPFDDPFVVAGQGTVGLEILEQVPNLDTAIVPLSGGGLIGGIAIALKSANQKIRIVAVSASNARVMYESVQAAEPIAFPEEETIANALSGGIGLNNRYTFPLVRDYVDHHVLVSESEIRDAMRAAATEDKIVVEGGGAVGLAAVVAGKIPSPGKRNVVVVSGGNVSIEVLTDVLTESPAEDQ
jgi:threonine dehydratase